MSGISNGISNGSLSKTQVISEDSQSSSKAGTTEQSTNGEVKTVSMKKLVRKSRNRNELKHKLWLGGHAAVVVFGSLSLLIGLLRLNNRYYIHSILYRLTFLGAIVALATTTSHRFGISNLPPTSALLAHQNFQYFILAGVWFFTFKSVFKIIPYFLISLLQLAHTKNISVIVKASDFLASLIAYDELLLILYLFLRTLLFRNTSGYQFLAFLTFYWLRILYNKETNNLFSALIEKVDDKVSSVKNEKAQTAWKKTKFFISEKQSQYY